MVDLNSLLGAPYERYWCPFGRISVQTVTAQGIQAVPTGAFNTTVLYAPGSSKNDMHLSARCCGPNCQVWRRSLFAPFRGRCGATPLTLVELVVWGCVVVLAAGSGHLLFQALGHV